MSDSIHQSSPVPPSLKKWFMVHFYADLIFAIPLLTSPEWTLSTFGWNPTQVDPLSSRLSASALMGIGIESLLCQNSSLDVYRSMLNLKSIWSLSAVCGIIAALYQWGDQAPWGSWLFLGIFASFSILWNTYRIRLRDV